jgi:hypothetical protein
MQLSPPLSRRPEPVGTLSVTPESGGGQCKTVLQWRGRSSWYWALRRPAAAG